LKNERKSDVRKKDFGKNIEFIDILEKLSQKELIRLSKEIGLISVKKGGANRKGEALQGTWINRDLSVKYAEWLDPEFSIWISQKILELVNDGVSWNEIRAITKRDYKPLTDAIEKHMRPIYPRVNNSALKSGACRLGINRNLGG
jgi:hypothetical protein